LVAEDRPLSQEIRVAPADISTSGSVVAGHAEDVHAVHAASDARIDAAITGWTGSSAAAMAAKAAQWQVTSRTMSANLAAHAEALHSSGPGFEATETDNAESVSQVGEQAYSTAV
jgi:WXG100 family type VII secretion target